MATCTATSTAPVRLRSNADRMGRMLSIMAGSSLALEVHRGGEASYAPRRVESGGECRRDREDHGPDDAHEIEVRELLVAAALAEVCRGVQVVYGGKSERRQREAQE